MDRYHAIRKQDRKTAAMKWCGIDRLESRRLMTSVVVNSISDTDTTPGVITLRDAVTIANNSTDPKEITFDPTVFAAAQTITLSGTDLELSNAAEPTTIIGPAGGVTIDGNALSQGFVIDAGVTATISDLSITNCSSDVGAGIEDAGTLTLTGCTLFNNDATSNDDGGGLAVEGTATLVNDTIANNTGDGLDQRGGDATLVNCTISGNTSYAPFSGAGIYEQDSGDVTVANCIIAGNTADSGGPDVFGAFISLGNNLIGATDGSTGWISSDYTGTVAALLSPDLGALANNGGPTQTMLPLTGSPAIGTGSVALVPSGITTDQRGLPRLYNGKVDIGAVEVPETAVTAESIGGLDSAFGNQGLASHDVGFTSTNGVAQDGTQSVLIGTMDASPDESFGLTRYNADGSLDAAFGTGGVTGTSFSGTDDVPAAVDVLGGGQILVAGTATTFTSGVASGSEFAVAEFNPDGSIDTSFGNGTGQMLVSFSKTAGTLSNDLLQAMAVGAGGVIYLAGSSDAAGSGTTDFALAALNSNGTVDTGFGTGGQVLLSFGAGDDAVNGVALQSNGDIVAAGSATINGLTGVALARFLPGGLLDTHFGTKGLVTANLRGVYDSASSVVIQPKGQIVIGGLSATGSGASLSSDFLVQRYTTTGRLDRSFGGTGTVFSSFGQPSAVTQVILQANGEIVASGKTTATLSSFSSNTLDVAIARYTVSGALDTSFNGTGKTIIDLSAGVVSTSLHTGLFSDLAIQPLDASTLGAEFASFVTSQQGVVSVTTGGEILDAGNSGANTVEAELITAGVDLAASLLSMPPTAVVGGARATALVLIAEDGTNLATGTVTIEVEVAADTQGDGAISLMAVAERINLRQKQSHAYRVAFVYPQSITAGDYYLIADVENGSTPSLMDLNPLNNLAASTNTVNIAPPFISLTGSSLSTASTFTVDKTATAIFTLTNNGNVTGKGATVVDFILSPDQTAGDGTVIDAAKLSVGLASAKSRVSRISFKLSSAVTSGTYYLIAVIDPLRSLGTIDQTNSTVVDPTRLLLG